jgi:Exostosin family
VSAVDVRVVGIAGPRVDYPVVIARHFRENGLRCELHSIPSSRVWEPWLPLVREIRRELRRTPEGAVSVYCSGLTELYVKDADLGLHFSAFRSWFDPERMRLLPHHWTTSEPRKEQKLAWRAKPPFVIGFMGTAYADSRMGRLVSSAPFGMKERLLRGRHLRSASTVAALQAARIPLRYAMTFPRPETLRAVEFACRARGADVRVVDTGGFTGSDEQVQSYLSHMEDVTYVLCPRGIENFSFRFYEALKFGRVPVLIDTETVLPDGIDWDAMIVRVPYGRLCDVGEILAEDYETRSAADFVARQKLALRTIEDLQSNEWLDRLTGDVRRRLAAKSSRNGVKVLDSALTV